VSRQKKINIYKTMIKPVLMCMIEKDKVKLSAWERTVTAQGNWRIRTNQEELRELHKSSDLVSNIKG
jgi:hypothetical protein